MNRVFSIPRRCAFAAAGSSGGRGLASSRAWLVFFWLVLLLARLESARAASAAVAESSVSPVVPLKAIPFDLREVRLLDGPFRHAMELDREYLLSLDVDRLLHNFRVNAGLPSSARPLGGWEDPKGELRGHFVGHYLSACALMYASTGDDRLKAKGDAVAAGLAECQAKLGNGYLSAFPESFIDRVERQEPVWAPWYTLHKILAGLLDMSVYCDNQQALEVARRFGDWVKMRADKLSDDQMQRMLRTEQGGINEALANLYSLTGGRKYLDLSRRFNHMAVIGPLSRGEDRLTGLHANTQIPKFIGAAREYELTGDKSLEAAALNFWDTVVSNRSYVIGGNSDGEMFTPTNRLSRMGPTTTETCNTYNMLKLTRHLFSWDPKAEYADYYERALYNHILASQNPETGMMCYYVPLRSGSRKYYNTPLNSFWCCTGTGVENHAKYGDSIYFHDDNQGLYVNLFIASELNWRAKGIQLRQETRYPDEASTHLVFTCAQPVELALHLRHPAWATSGFEIRVNGRKQRFESPPGSYATVTRSWRTGDAVDIRMPFTLHTVAFHDNPARFAFLDGPLVLCAQVDIHGPAHRPRAADAVAAPGARLEIAPAVVGKPGHGRADLHPVRGQPNTFRGSADIFRTSSAKSATPLTFVPFYQMFGDRYYVVYWDSYTPAQWKIKEAQQRLEIDRQRALDARTVDAVYPGNSGNERAHDLQGERMGAGEFNGRGWRHAWDGGWFSYALKLPPNQPAELCLTFWGSDAGGRVFDVLVDGHKLTTITLDSNHPEMFYDETLPIPADLTRNKSQFNVRFQAHTRRTAGGLFGLRVLRLQ
ncbi:MAG: glycoside hydrolase family 127 protein [Verrucomicrobia bacterium]|nr:glycoside hydrolase family 127 protein [Verrucomicrobiota bacterium]